MNIFLTGGTGQIGSAAARKLVEASRAVTVYDSLVTGYRAAVPDQAAFIQGDLANGRDLAAVLALQGFSHKPQLGEPTRTVER